MPISYKEMMKNKKLREFTDIVENEAEEKRMENKPKEKHDRRFAECHSI